MKKDADSYIQQCSVCQQAKHSLSHPTGLLQPLPIPEGVWQDISMDFIEGLPKSEGYSVILVVVDRLTLIDSLSLPISYQLNTPTQQCQLPKYFWNTLLRCMGYQNQ